MIPVDDVIGRADWILWPAYHFTRLHRPDAYARVPAPESSEPGPADGAHG